MATQQANDNMDVAMVDANEKDENVKLIVSFHGKKMELFVSWNENVGDVKDQLLALDAMESNNNNNNNNDDRSLLLSDIKLLYKGKVLQDNDALLSDILQSSKKRIYKFMAMGISSAQQQEHDRALERGLKVNRIRDDLSPQGQMEMAKRKRLGKQMLMKKAQHHANNDKKFGFGRIETLPDLPDTEKAKSILQQLANDVGILACMAKHEWNVGCLSELYPKGNVGQSPVCVMGLNQNKGQTIFLRLRTDDLRGFRKMTSIRKVLYHELAHNVHSDHDNAFFQLMRQIERECTSHAMNGVSTMTTQDDNDEMAFQGGTFRLGGGGGGGGENGQHEANPTTLSTRELAARAALLRLSAEEKEIEQNCACSGGGASFLPQNLLHDHGGGGGGGGNGVNGKQSKNF